MHWWHIIAEYSTGEMKLVNEYRLEGRFKMCAETEAIIAAKIQGLELVELLLIKEFNRRVRVSYMFTELTILY